jgi:hypothetical protein
VDAIEVPVSKSSDASRDAPVAVEESTPESEVEDLAVVEETDTKEIQKLHSVGPGFLLTQEVTIPVVNRYTSHDTEIENLIGEVRLLDISFKQGASDNPVVSVTSWSDFSMGENLEAMDFAQDSLRNELQKSISDAIDQELLSSAAVRVAGATLSTGYLAWLLRAGPLMASVAASLPMWARFDPVPVLLNASPRAEAAPGPLDEDDADQEAAAARVLEEQREDAKAESGHE